MRFRIEIEAKLSHALLYNNHIPNQRPQIDQIHLLGQNSSDFDDNPFVAWSITASKPLEIRCSPCSIFLDEQN